MPLRGSDADRAPGGILQSREVAIIDDGSDMCVGAQDDDLRLPQLHSATRHAARIETRRGNCADRTDPGVQERRLCPGFRHPFA